MSEIEWLFECALSAAKLDEESKQSFRNAFQMRLSQESQEQMSLDEVTS